MEYIVSCSFKWICPIIALLFVQFSCQKPLNSEKALTQQDFQLDQQLLPKPIQTSFDTETDYEKIDGMTLVAPPKPFKANPFVKMKDIHVNWVGIIPYAYTCLLYTSPSPRDRTRSRMPSSA